MQCPSCEFNNMPGAKRCARCQASLSLDSVSVLPPRASRRDKAIPSRLRSTLTRMWLGTADTASQGLGLDRSRVHFQGSFVDWLSLCFGGLYQFMHGESLGRWWFGAWILLGLASLALIPSTLASVCLGLFFSVHLISIADVFFRQNEPWETRIRFIGLTLLALGALYFSLFRSIGQFITPVQYFVQTSDLVPGDTLWYFDTNSTKPGDLVVYDLTQVDISYRQNDYPFVYRASGVRINRQVAQAGQVVSWKNGKLLVDGTESSWQPGSFMADVEDFEVIVNQDSVFVTPEGILNGYNRAGRVDIGRYGVIPRRNVMGRVFLRSYPWTSIRWY